MNYFDSPRTETYLRADLADMLRAVARAGMGPRNRRITPTYSQSCLRRWTITTQREETAHETTH